MLFGAGLWMRFQKMVEHVEKGQNMLPVVTRLAAADVIDNHVPDFFRAVLLVREILSKRGRSNFWHMLMLSDGEHLLFGEATKRHAVLKCNHAPQLKCDAQMKPDGNAPRTNYPPGFGSALGSSVVTEGGVPFSAGVPSSSIAGKPARK